jgi:hypothetical protein
MGTEVLSQTSTVDSPVDPHFDPKQSLDKVLEQLEPFRQS